MVCCTCVLHVPAWVKLVLARPSLRCYVLACIACVMCCACCVLWFECFGLICVHVSTPFVMLLCFGLTFVCCVRVLSVRFVCVVCVLCVCCIFWLHLCVCCVCVCECVVCVCFVCVLCVCVLCVCCTCLIYALCLRRMW